MKRYQQSTRLSNRGLTLIEMLVVLAILTVVSFTVFKKYVTRENHEAPEIVTKTTMGAVKAALVGDSQSRYSYYGDMGYLRDPKDIEKVNGLLKTNPKAADLGCLIFQDQTLNGKTTPEPEPEYNPVTKRGWRGPYIADAGIRYSTDNEKVIETVFFAQGKQGFDGFEYGDVLILDGWGMPLVLGHKDDTDYYWLVSAGENRILETNLTNPSSSRGDDLVLFLLTEDPKP